MLHDLSITVRQKSAYFSRKLDDNVWAVMHCVMQAWSSWHVIRMCWHTTALMYLKHYIAARRKGRISFCCGPHLFGDHCIRIDPCYVAIELFSIRSLILALLCFVSQVWCVFQGHCIAVFSEDGKFIHRLGDESLTAYPNGIDTSDSGDILVGDSHGNRFHIVVLQRNGTVTAQLECPYMKVSRCCGLRVTSEGYIVTLSKNNQHVLVYNTVYVS